MLIAIVIIATSCNRSQFSTATKHTKNGRVTYINNYHRELSKPSKKKSHQIHKKEDDLQKSISAIEKRKVQNPAEPESIKIIPALIPVNENLLASASNEQSIILMNKKQFRSTDNQILSYHNLYRIKKDNCPPDSIKFIAPKQGTTMDFSAEYVIRFKHGTKKSVGLIYQSHDTLFYQLISNPRITKFILVEQVDTIFKVKYYDSMRAQVVDTRKPDKLGSVGLIFSFLGTIPFIGLPFAIAAVILGAISLRKINRHPEQYRGINHASASLIIGILGIALSTILIILLAISGGGGVSMGMGQ